MKKKNDPEYKLVRSLRRRLYNYIKQNSYSKKSTIKYIGCSPEQLKIHIQSQFKDGMTWENYGYYGWHIDHKIPLASHKNEDELYLLCHYSNLQPPVLIQPYFDNRTVLFSLFLGYRTV